MKVLMYDHSGSLNHGCEAIVRSTVEIIKKAFPGSEFGLCSYCAEQDLILSDVSSLTVTDMAARKLTLTEKYINAFNIKLLHNQNYYYKTAYSDVFGFAQNYDLCLIIGGDTFCYGNNEKCRMITSQLKKMGKKVVLWGCSVGEENLDDEKLRTLRSLDAVFARESFTREVLEARGLDNVSVFPDPAFVLAKNEPPSDFCNGRMLGINLSPLVARRTKGLGRTAAEFLYYIEHNTDYTPVLVPHATVRGGNDHEFLSAVAKAAKSEKSILLSPDLGARDYKGFVSSCEMFLGARTHAIIGAYSSLVPAFAIGYSIKARGIAKDLFGKELCVRGIDKITRGAELINCFEELCENAASMKKTLETKIPQTVADAYSAGQALKTIL